jgi:hypothetical protein
MSAFLYQNQIQVFDSMELARIAAILTNTPLENIFLVALLG